MSLSSSYLTADPLPISFDLELDFVGIDEEKEASNNIEDNGELNSSISSSLVYAFLTTQDLLLLSLSDSLPTSPIMVAMEVGEGGKYTMGDALHGKFLTHSFPYSTSSCFNFKTKSLDITIKLLRILTNKYWTTLVRPVKPFLFL